jgi:deoxyribonuclease IV
MAKIVFGPAGIGKVKEVSDGFRQYSDLGFGAAEIPFTYGVYIKKGVHDKEIGELREMAKKFGIDLSIHAPYWINLNSKEEEKIEASKKRILDSCEIAHLIGAGRVVFHAGFYGKDDRGEVFEKIKEQIIEMMKFIEEKKWDVELCPEVMGKINVFGSIDEISKLVSETGCGFCIDFAHILARYGKYEFGELVDKFPAKNWHCHFSGIEYGEKGEKKHIATSKEDWRAVLDFLKSVDKNVRIINEGDNPVKESVLGLKVWESL